MIRGRVVRRDGRTFCSQSCGARKIHKTPPVVGTLVSAGIIECHNIDGEMLIDLNELIALADRLYCVRCGHRLPQETAA
jgi:hypothetical protein